MEKEFYLLNTTPRIRLRESYMLKRNKFGLGMREDFLIELL